MDHAQQCISMISDYLECDHEGVANESLFSRFAPNVKIVNKSLITLSLHGCLPLVAILKNLERFKYMQKLKFCCTVPLNFWDIRQFLTSTFTTEYIGQALSTQNDKSRVQFLKFDGTVITINQLKVLPRYMPNIKMIVFKKVFLFLDMLFTLASMFTNLEKLTFNECCFGANFIGFENKLEKLENCSLWPKLNCIRLNVDARDFVPELRHLQFLFRFTCLESVEIFLTTSCDKMMTIDGIEGLFLVFQDVPFLKFIQYEMHHSKSFPKTDLVLVLENVKNLKEFSIIFDDEETFANITYLLEITEKNEFFPVKDTDHPFTFAHHSVLKNYIQLSNDDIFDFAGYSRVSE
jgi:hypothetical protein